MIGGVKRKNGTTQKGLLSNEFISDRDKRATKKIKHLWRLKQLSQVLLKAKGGFLQYCISQIIF